MTDSELPKPDLLDLADLYAMDAVSGPERQSIERGLDAADDATVSEFEATVQGVRETLASLSVLDAQGPPAALESRVMRALDDAAETDQETLAITVEPAGGSPQPTTTPVAGVDLV